MIRKLLFTIFALSIVCASILGWRVWIGYQSLNSTVKIDEPVVFNILPGDHLQKIGSELQQLGLISDPSALYFYGRFFNLAREIKVGEFELYGRYTPIGLLEKFTTNKVKKYQITFAEGITFDQMLSHVQSQPKIKVTLFGSKSERREELMRYLSLPGEHPEGRFFPSTYHYPAGIEDRNLLRIAFQTMEGVLDEEWHSREPNLPYKTPYEALIMASIVEKETGAPEERDQIAGVFERRLNKRMRLQTDPTVIYGLGDQYHGNLKRKHLNDKNNPYNSYAIKGLPPTPIAMPGREAIRATLHPADGKYLYFVAKGDGTHQFSSTLEQHNAAVRKYQLKRRSDYRSTK